MGVTKSNLYIFIYTIRPDAALPNWGVLVRINSHEKLQWLKPDRQREIEIEIEIESVWAG